VPEAVIVATARSPIGRAFKGSLTDVRPDDLTAAVVSAALAKVPALDPHDIDDLLLGCGLPGGEQGFNMGRVVATLLGFDHLPGATITRYCSSSLQTTRMALHAIKAGEADVVISAGVETVSRFVKGNSDLIPGQELHNPRFADAQARSAQRASESGAWTDPREDGQLPDIYIAMGETAENVALLRDVSRAEMDEFGARSQNLARRPSPTASSSGRSRRSPRRRHRRQHRRRSPCRHHRGDAVRLKPVFRADGRITAGNACPLNDGAAALVIMSDTKAAELGSRRWPGSSRPR
jgi:acetyl-CoA C-acetyltransferase